MHACSEAKRRLLTWTVQGPGGSVVARANQLLGSSRFAQYTWYISLLFSNSLPA